MLNIEGTAQVTDLEMIPVARLEGDQPVEALSNQQKLSKAQGAGGKPYDRTGLGLTSKPVAGNGACLYNSIAEWF